MGRTKAMCGELATARAPAPGPHRSPVPVGPRSPSLVSWHRLQGGQRSGGALRWGQGEHLACPDCGPWAGAVVDRPTRRGAPCGQGSISVFVWLVLGWKRKHRLMKLPIINRVLVTLGQFYRS